jgi:DNA-binding response OmpR family regulator
MSDLHLVPILYVDDEPLIQDMVEAALQDAGFSVVLATTPAEALEAIRSPELRGLVTDINLAHPMDGWEVARHARETHPQMPVVYVSGLCEADWTVKGVPQSLMIAKPFAPAQIIVALSTLMVMPTPRIL